MPCFQQICLQLPALVLFAIFSAYHFGHQTVLVRRSRIQTVHIYVRAIATFLLAVLPFYDLFHMIRNGVRIWPIDVLLNCMEIFTWMIHLGKPPVPMTHHWPLLMLHSIDRILVVASKSWRFESPRTTVCDRFVAVERIVGVCVAPNEHNVG